MCGVEQQKAVSWHNRKPQPEPGLKQQPQAANQKETDADAQFILFLFTITIQPAFEASQPLQSQSQPTILSPERDMNCR